jgi:hypothetical protein
MLLDKLLQLERLGRVSLEPFTYSAVFPIAAFVGGATLAVNVNIQGDSDFAWRYTTLAAYTAINVPQVAPDYTIAFADTGSGRNLQDQAIHVSLCTGTAQLPYILPEPYRLAAASVLIVTMTNTGGVPALAQVALGGFKIYALQGYNR